MSLPNHSSARAQYSVVPLTVVLTASPALEKNKATIVPSRPELRISGREGHPLFSTPVASVCPSFRSLGGGLTRCQSPPFPKLWLYSRRKWRHSSDRPLAARKIWSGDAGISTIGVGRSARAQSLANGEAGISAYKSFLVVADGKSISDLALNQKFQRSAPFRVFS